MAFTSLIEQMRQIILEDSRLDVLTNKYTKAKKKKSGKVVKPKIDYEKLEQIIKTDPTTKAEENGDIKKTGKYSQWLIAKFLSLESLCDIDNEYGTPDWEACAKQKKELFFEDLYKATDYLLKFNKLKTMSTYKGEKDINRFKDIDDLFMAIKDYDLNTIEASTTKEERREMEIHPGGELVFDGNRWRVVKITDNSLGKEAACYYGGNQRETNWCTSAPGLSYFKGYITRGPLYVVMDKTDKEVSQPKFGSGGEHKQTGLPKNRYQFHFEDNMFMNIDDRNIDIVDMMNGDMSELKDFFQPMFMTSMGTTNNNKPEHVTIKYGSDKLSKYITMYGAETLFEALPDNLERFQFEAESKDNFVLNLPESFYDKTSLKVLFVEGALTNISPSIGKLKNLEVLAISDNPNLKEIPGTICGLDKLMVLSVMNTPVEVPQCILDMEEDKSKNFYLVQ
tara:strand:+ start:857 stop:2209 length:1353 start_codon:yes stop_codon:yes gene_type:complete